MTVLVGYLPRPEGEAALLRAREEAGLRGTDLVVVHSHTGSEAEADADLARVHELLAAAPGDGTAAPDYVVRSVQRGFEAADDLLEAAEQTDADLLVIGLRRRSPVGKLVLGSSAQRLLLDAPCPVLAVKA